MKRLGKVTMFNRPVYLADVCDYADLTDLEFPTSHSVILLVSDASGVDSEVIYSAATRMIESGTTYVCAWGPDCERVHDLFDEADVGDGSKDPDDFIMTTWHCDASLGEAVEFFLTCAFPLDQHLDTCSWVVVTVGDTTLAKSVERKVAHFIRSTETTETQNKRMKRNN